MQANPLHTGNGGHPFNQFGQGLPLVQVYSIIGQFLGYHLKLLHATSDQIADFVQDFFHRARHVLACNDRYGTIGARAVASFRNLQISVVCGSSQGTFDVQLFIVLLAEIFQKLLPVEFPIELVHLWDFQGEFLQVAFGKASHDIQFLQMPFLLGLGKLKNHVDGFLLGISDESACIDDGYFAFGLLGIVSHPKA